MSYYEIFQEFMSKEYPFLEKAKGKGLRRAKRGKFEMMPTYNKEGHYSWTKIKR